MEPAVRDSAEIETETWDDPVRGKVSFQVVFSQDRTPTAALCTGVAELPVDGWLGLHRHTATEVYHLIEGSGVVVLDGQEHPVAAGSAVFIPGDTEHGIRNTGTGPLRCVHAFPADSFDDVHHRFSAEE